MLSSCCVLCWYACLQLGVQTGGWGGWVTGSRSICEEIEPNMPIGERIQANTQCRTATVREWTMTGRTDEQPTQIGIKDSRMEEVQEESRRTEKNNRKLLQETTTAAKLYK